MIRFAGRGGIAVLLATMTGFICARQMLGWSWAGIADVYAQLVPSAQSYGEAVRIVELYVLSDKVDIGLIRSKVEEIAKKNGFTPSSDDEEKTAEGGMDFYEKGPYVLLRLERRRIIAVVLSKLPRDQADYSKISGELSDALQRLGMTPEYPGPKE